MGLKKKKKKEDFLNYRFVLFEDLLNMFYCLTKLWCLLLDLNCNSVAYN